MRAPEKRLVVVSELRRQIVEGSLPPGKRLPTRVELEQHFNVSTATLQAAMHTLAHDGFIEPRGSSGTFVVENLPHMSNYAVIVPENPAYAASRFSNFWQAICNEAAVIEKERPLKFPVYYGVNFRKRDDYARLEQDVREHRLAGLIFAANPFMLDDSIVLSQAIPSVAIGTEMGRASTPSVYPDLKGFMVRSLDYLLKRKRKRVAIVQRFTGIFFDVGKLLAERDMTCMPYWHLRLGMSSPEAIRTFLQLLMMCPDRPEAVVIADDNIVPDATAGLLASGTRVPDDIEVIAHTNFPYPTKAYVPVKRIGYSIPQLMQRCIMTIDSLRHGETVQCHTDIEAITGDDFAPPEGAGSQSWSEAN